MKQRYIDTWKQLLMNLLGWTDEQVNEWIASTWSRELDDASNIIYHDPPVYWIVGLIADESDIGDLSGREYARLQRDVLDALDIETPNVQHEGNWTVYRQRINDILSKYNGELPVM